MRFPCKVLSFCHLLPANCFLLTITRDEQFVHVAWCYESYSRAQDGKGKDENSAQKITCLSSDEDNEGPLLKQVFLKDSKLYWITWYVRYPKYTMCVCGVQLDVTVSRCVARRWEPGALCKCLDREQPLPQQPPNPPLFLYQPGSGQYAAGFFVLLSIGGL